MNGENTNAVSAIADLLSEARALISVTAIIFGFLLSVSVDVKLFDQSEVYFLLAALFCGIITIGILTLPVVYHHRKFPLDNIEKFDVRYHYFISVSLFPFALMFFFATTFALHRLIPQYAYLLTGLAVGIILVTYVMRDPISKLIDKANML